MKKYYVRTEIKLYFKIEQEGFDMDTDPWTAVVRCGNNTVTCDRENNSHYSQEDECWYLLIDSKELGSGEYVVITDYDVPDSDFYDGYRHQTHKNVLGYFEFV